MDVSTALATAGISATVSALVSLTAVASVTVRQERAKRREAAREEIRAVVRPLQDYLARYVFTARNSAPPRELGGAMAMDDLADALRVIRASDPLPRWRRQLVERRVGRIYGEGVVRLIRDYPLSKGSSSDQAFSAWLTATLLAVELPDHPNQSLLHRTYSKPSSPTSGKPLSRELRRLSEAR